MYEGCSPCACGVPGACDAIVGYPTYMAPGIVVITLILLLLIALRLTKRINKIFIVLITLWFIGVLGFAKLVVSRAVTAGDYSSNALEACKASSDPSCEY